MQLPTEATIAIDLFSEDARYSSVLFLTLE